MVIKRFDGILETRLENSFGHVQLLHLPIDQSSAKGTGLLGMLDLG
jgi:hypothetical protein